MSEYRYNFEKINWSVTMYKSCTNSIRL